MIGTTIHAAIYGDNMTIKEVINNTTGSLITFDVKLITGKSGVKINCRTHSLQTISNGTG